MKLIERAGQPVHIRLRASEARRWRRARSSRARGCDLGTVWALRDQARAVAAEAMVRLRQNIPVLDHKGEPVSVILWPAKRTPRKRRSLPVS